MFNISLIASSCIGVAFSILNLRPKLLIASSSYPESLPFHQYLSFPLEAFYSQISWPILFLLSPSYFPSPLPLKDSWEYLSPAYAFVTNNNVIPESQSGFYGGHSTTTELLHMPNYCSQRFWLKPLIYIMSLVALDFTNALDTINYDFLLAKLRYTTYLPCYSLSPILSSSRSQHVLIYNPSPILSSSRCILSGISSEFDPGHLAFFTIVKTL